MIIVIILSNRLQEEIRYRKLHAMQVCFWMRNNVRTSKSFDEWELKTSINSLVSFERGCTC